MYDQNNFDYEQALFNINQRINKTNDPDVYKFNCKITQSDINTYTRERERKIQFDKNSNIMFNVYLWNISFASSYGFPNNKLGFNGQWMEHKMTPIAQYLSGIDLNENVHICYREITDSDEQSLDYLCDNLYMGNRKTETLYKDRKSSGNDEDNINTYNNYNKYIKKLDDKISFELFNYEYYCIEQNPIQYICPSYNEFYLNHDDARNKNNSYLTISNYSDIEENLPYIYNCSSHLYEDKENFDNEYDRWIYLFDKLKQLFDTIGHDKPLWTAFLPENISKFNEVRVLTKCGNFLNIVARSDKYFYFMQYTS
jgi:hypothetical protein